MRNGFLRAVAIAAIAIMSMAQALAQNYPSRSITLVVPFPAGTTTDLVGRILSDELAKVDGTTMS